MRLTPPHAPTKSEAAYAALLRAIQTGDLAPGQRVIITEVAEQLGMSLTPVRDALALLAEQGLVVRRPNHMTVISEHTRERSAEVSMLRSVLEPEAAMLAAVRADPDALAAIEAACTAMDRATAGSGTAGAGDANVQFHRAVAAAGGSDLLADFIDRLWKQIPLQGLTLTGRLAQAADEHRVILAAIKDHDGERARQLMAEHVGRAAAAAEAFLDQIRVPPRS
ncbi:GntR family transcriptional regulator [Actinacidiphila acididurans]|uniref:GntR family transcriptional regulator n=1 Tax=Actinacidiphila acididurans TaxID=2784346 RepID=A0ABS2U107_9ACTN|nr:GntR family transcriptional regulator [Actinacidiphila acididurans]MBM9508220.1 GntR family transcriptional regulator [Actinacidiphila acididurans]